MGWTVAGSGSQFTLLLLLPPSPWDTCADIGCALPPAAGRQHTLCPLPPSPLIWFPFPFGFARTGLVWFWDPLPALPDLPRHAWDIHYHLRRTLRAFATACLPFPLLPAPACLLPARTHHGIGTVCWYGTGREGRNGMTWRVGVTTTATLRQLRRPPPPHPTPTLPPSLSIDPSGGRHGGDRQTGRQALTVAPALAHTTTRCPCTHTHAFRTRTHLVPLPCHACACGVVGIFV